MGHPFGGSGRAWPPIPRLWDGETVVILAGGESASEEDAKLVWQKAKVIVVNNSFRLAPWADLLHACDAKWWKAYADPVDGLMSWRDFGGIKTTLTATVEGVHRIPYDDKPGLSLDPLRVHSGANGGFQALNIAVLMGAARVILLGFDMQGSHWHGNHIGLNNPEETQFEMWKAAFATVGDVPGVEIVNASRRTALKCFPRVSLDALF